MSSKNTTISNHELDKIFNSAKNIFFVGIGGICMSSLAEYCIHLRKNVFGYDRTRNDECKKLETLSHIKYCSSPDNVIGMDLVVYSNAIDESNFELKSAKDKNIPIVSRANFLGYIMSKYDVKIGVSGMHGKSTLTSMLAHIFNYACLSPTVFCGAKMKEFSSAYHFGKNDFFIFEACEYMNSFLNFSPSDAVVTNIDFDHPDFFSDTDEIKKSFNRYILPSKRVFLNADNDMCMSLSHPFKITFGIDNNADYRAKIIHSPGKNKFLVEKFGTKVAEIELKQFGKYMVSNAICAYAVASEHKIPNEAIVRALECFEGSARRQDFIKSICINGHRVPVFTDYAHHPTEISSSIQSFKDMGYQKILCVFQAHTYSRTYMLYKDFMNCFSGVNELIITPIYSARETNIYPISSQGFAFDLKGEFYSDYNAIAQRIANSSADCIIIMGAGDIENLKNYIK